MAVEVGIQNVIAQLEEAFKAHDYRRAEALIWPALDQFPQLAVLWFYAGNTLYNVGKLQLAIRCFEKCLDLTDSPMVAANLGATYRRLNAISEGRTVLKSVIEREPEHVPALVNMGALFVNEGKPEPGIEHLERALALQDDPGARWNLSLLYLESGQYGRGFDLYHMGVGHERHGRTFKDGDYEPKVLDPKDVVDVMYAYHDKTLLVYGEQGIGDELMFGTIIKEARALFKEVYFECHPRLESLHRAAHPDLKIVPSRKSEPSHELCLLRADYKAPIGDLAAIFRRRPEDFLWTSTYHLSEDMRTEAASYRTRLLAAARGRKIVGLATRGGVMQTSRDYRTLRKEDIEALFATDAFFVSLDYDDMTAFTAHVSEKYGEDRFLWLPSIVQHWDYHHVAALISATDLTVAVCQSVAHLSAGLGHPTRVLTPKRCAWRYAGPSEQWYWYPHRDVKLYRQKTEDDWSSPIARVVEDING